MIIVKIQRPLESNKADPPALVYNKDRTFEMLVPFDNRLRDIMGAREKIYCEVLVVGPDISVIREVKAQSW